MNVIVGKNNSGKSTIFEGLNYLRQFHNNKGLGMNLLIHNPEQDFIKLVNSYDGEKTIGFELVLKEFPNVVFDLDIGMQMNPVANYNVRKKENNRIISISHEVFGYGDFNKYLECLKDIMYISPMRNNIEYSSSVTGSKQTMQKLDPDGKDINQFLIKQFTSRHKYWDTFEKWLKKIDPNIISFKSRLEEGVIFLESDRNGVGGDITTSVNAQGTGIQNIIQIMAAVFFSKEGGTVIIEEPEVFLHPKSIEVLVDLFNYAVNYMGKQIIITTHSMEVINTYCSDVGEGTKRGEQHEKIKAEDFTLYIINDDPSKPKIEEYSLVGKKYSDVRSDFKELWG